MYTFNSFKLNSLVVTLFWITNQIVTFGISKNTRLKPLWFFVLECSHANFTIYVTGAALQLITITAS